MLSALLLIFPLIGLLIIHDRVKYRRIYKLLEKFPGPKSIPLIGLAYDFRSIDVIIGSYLKYFYLYGSTIAAWIFRVPIVLVSDPKHLKIILNNENCLDKEKRYQFSRHFFGNGLLIAPAKIWKKNRKLINPTMNQKILDSFVDIFVKHSDLMLADMEKNIPENKLFDVDHFIIEYAMDILIESALGINEDIPKPPGFLANINRIPQIVVQRSFQVWLHPDCIFRLSPLGREFYRLFDKVVVYFNRLTEKKFRQFHSRDKDELSFDDNKKKPFLEHLLSVGNQLTIEELQNEVIVFLSAGIDTTSATMGYLFVCLGAMQDIQEKVVEELFDVFGESDRPICVEDLPKLQYLERVIKESMRLFPSAPFMARSVNEDIDIGDYVIPKGASLIVPIVATHRNEKLWPDPLKFDPDRFLPSEVAKRHPYSYLPFSAGPRNCLGKQYAMMSIKIMATYILRKYKIDTNIKLENIRSQVQIVARIIGGANISIVKRERCI